MILKSCRLFHGGKSARGAWRSTAWPCFGQRAGEKGLAFSWWGGSVLWCSQDRGGGGGRWGGGDATMACHHAQAHGRQLRSACGSPAPRQGAVLVDHDVMWGSREWGAVEVASGRSREAHKVSVD